MKRNLLLLMACSLFVSTYSQTNPGEPCCNIFLKIPKDNIVVARDQTTGRLYSFRVNATDMKSVENGDIVHIDQLSSTITSIKGSARSYSVIEPDKAEPAGILSGFRVDYGEPINVILHTRQSNSSINNNNMNIYSSKALGSDQVNMVKNKISDATPCCSIVSIQADPVEPCCNVISYKNGLTGSVSQFKAPKNISNTMKIGDPVYAEPVNVIRVSKSEQSDAQPCCSVVSVNSDPIQPCCSVVTYKNNSTGASFQFRVNKNLSPVKVGEPLYAEPVNGFAIVQSSYGSSNGGMNSYGYAATSDQNNNNPATSSEKWVITPVSMKGVLGKLNTAFPADVDWTIDIRTTADKFITNRNKSGNQNHYDIAPGLYYFRLNTITVENVPIEQGKETRLKTGVLNIVSEGSWNLYDNQKQKFHTSGSKPKKLALPVGNYQLKLGGQFYPVIIKDFETVEM